MFDRIANLLKGDSAESSVQLAADETSLAAAALLIHAAKIDGTESPEELAKLKHLLAAQFELADRDLDILLAKADAEESEAVDLYRFTSALTRSLDQDGRKNIVEMLWKVSFADGVIHEFEDNLVWRVAELLGVSSRDRMLLKKKVQAESASI